MSDRRNSNNNDGNGNGPYRRRGDARPPPAVGEIWEGTVERIQPYGAFCNFGPPLAAGQHPHHRQQQQRQRRAWQGLVHISQLSETRVEKVEDVVDIDDRVWVKVLEVETQDKTRIKISMKDVSQDGTGQDFGLERETREHAKTQLETNLNSMIGMGVARDPMERLVLKSSNNGTMATKTTFRGGYTLVDDDEGEPEQVLPEPITSVAAAAHPNIDNNNTYRTAPMGRGRGATLPAWMTSKEGPVGLSNDRKKSQSSRAKPGRNNEDVDGKYRDCSDDDDDHAGNRRRVSSRDEKKEGERRRKKKSRRRRLHSDRSDSGGSGNRDTSDSEGNRRDEDERRHRKHYKSSSSSRHRRREHRKHSSKRREKKSKKRSHRRDDYESDISDDGDYHRRSKKRRYENDELSRGSSVCGITSDGSFHRPSKRSTKGRKSKKKSRDGGRDRSWEENKSDSRRFRDKEGGVKGEEDNSSNGKKYGRRHSDSDRRRRTSSNGSHHSRDS